ncbi:hypothetical protein TUSST3_59820 [Streptomyces sp. TUS-ST3]|jgi:hypothetical protein|nr:hypothetical protein TUSST3_59820 [Streptomyces sp. TUS-ST3]
MAAAQPVESWISPQGTRLSAIRGVVRATPVAGSQWLVRSWLGWSGAVRMA